MSLSKRDIRLLIGLLETSIAKGESYIQQIIDYRRDVGPLYGTNELEVQKNNSSYKRILKKLVEYST